jgi:hypothetical protein
MALTRLFSYDATNARAVALAAFTSRRRAVQPTSPHDAVRIDAAGPYGNVKK